MSNGMKWKVMTFYIQKLKANLTVTLCSGYISSSQQVFSLSPSVFTIAAFKGVRGVLLIGYY